MRTFKLFSILIIGFCLTSCHDNSVSFGTVEYYPKFLWVDSNIDPVTKTFDFDFSQDAKNDESTFAEFQFVDNDGNPISTDVLHVYMDGEQLPNNKFRVKSDVTSKELRFEFTPDAKNGKHQGYLKLIDHRLDRLDSQELSKGQKVDAFQWTLEFEKSMNPLLKGIMWFFIILISCLLIWFIILRPIIYPHFGKFTKSILIKKNGQIVGQLNCAFKGSKKVVFYKQKIKQSFWNRIFTGEIKTLVNPNFNYKLTFTPKRRNAAAFGAGYSVSPNPIPQSGIATIKNIQDNLIITLQ